MSLPNQNQAEQNRRDIAGGYEPGDAECRIWCSLQSQLSSSQRRLGTFTFVNGSGKGAGYGNDIDAGSDGADDGVSALRIVVSGEILK
jgi:hypothetical protein